MVEEPNIVRVAALIGDHTRATMLSALMSGSALTATELASAAGITKQTASAHLRKLSDARLISVASQGRHRYFCIADAEVAELMEKLMGVAIRSGIKHLQPGPKDPLLRKARVCYDHLAGEMGVALFDSFKAQGLIAVTEKQSTDNISQTKLDLTTEGEAFFSKIGIPIQLPNTSRRAICRSCLDWSVRKHHLAGFVGASILEHCFHKKWAKREEGSRIVRFSVKGEKQFSSVLMP